MKKLLLLLFLFPLFAGAQIYQSMPQAGYGPVKRMLFDSVLTLPLGITKLQNATGGRDVGQIRYNVTDSSLYSYTGYSWRKAGSNLDTTTIYTNLALKLNISDTASMMAAAPRVQRFLDSVTNLKTSINLKLNIADTANKYVTRVFRKTASDSVFYVKGGTNTFAFKDSTGGGSQNLQQVTNIGAYTTQNIIVDDYAGQSTTIGKGNIFLPNLITGSSLYLSNNAFLQFTNVNNRQSLLKNSNSTDNIILEFPDKAAGSYTIATSDDLVTPNLQQVTFEGNNTDQSINMDGGTLYMNGGNVKFDIATPRGVSWGDGVNTKLLLPPASLSSTTTNYLPDVDGILATSVNGIAADVSGEITIPTASTSENGLLSATDWNTFNEKLNASDTNYLSTSKLNKSDTASMMAAAPRVQRFLDSVANLKISIATKQNTLTLTTTGTSGAATLTGATLNVPQYSGTNIYNSDGSLTGNRTLTLNSQPLTFLGTTRTRFFANGRLNIGDTVDAGYKLDITGNLRLLGTGSRSVIVTPADGTGNAYLTLDNQSQLNLQAGYGGYIFKFADGTNTSTPINISHNLVQPGVVGSNLTSLGTSGNRFNNIFGLNISADQFQFGGTTALSYYGSVSTGIFFDLTAKNLRYYNNGSQTMQAFANGNYQIQTAGTFTDVASSILTLNSTTKGFISPRMTTIQRTAITSPAEGLTVYDLTLHKLYVYDGTIWQAAW